MGLVVAAAAGGGVETTATTMMCLGYGPLVTPTHDNIVCMSEVTKTTSGGKKKIQGATGDEKDDDEDEEGGSMEIFSPLQSGVVRRLTLSK